MKFEIRKAERADFAVLREIELAAFETLRAAGAVSGEATASDDAALQRFLDDGFLYVACDDAGTLVGYAGGYLLDGWVYIGEVDVLPDYQQKGVGRRLLLTMLEKGRDCGLAGATLTTDRIAPFNAPFYASLGFGILNVEECPQSLLDILNYQVARGADPARRVAMRLDFQTPSGRS